MKQLLLALLALPLAGCPVDPQVEIYNNSEAIVYVHGSYLNRCSPPCEIRPGTSRRIHGRELEHHSWDGKNPREFVWLTVRWKLREYQVTRDVALQMFRHDENWQPLVFLQVQSNGDILLLERGAARPAAADSAQPAGFPLHGVVPEWAGVQ